MSNLAQKNKAALTRIAPLKSVRKFNALEDKWIAALRTLTKDPLSAFDVTLASEVRYKKILSYIQSLQLTGLSKTRDLDGLILQYQGELKAIYNDIRVWLVLYLDLSFFKESDDVRYRKKLKKIRKCDFKNEANTYWKGFASSEPGVSEDDAVAERLLRLKDKRDACSENSQRWRNFNHQLVCGVFDRLMEKINESGVRIHKLFERVVYRESADSFAPQKAGPFHQRMFKQGVEDWILGYHPPSSKESKLDRQVFDKYNKNLKGKHYTRRFKQIIKTVCAGLLILGLITFFRVSTLDNDIYEYLSTRIKKILSLDAASLRLNKQKKFFYNQIITIKEDYKAEELMARLKVFDSMEHLDDQEKALYFAENILKGYLLLLPDWNTSKDLKKKVLVSAYQLDEDIYYHLMEITNLFTKPTMHETHLRRYMLMLRKAFVKEDVFPFMFLSLHKDRPYIFLYPEKIIDRKYFNMEELESIELNVAFYSHHASIPLVAHIVGGANYPFKERAGYFEGQYAIVFSHIARNPNWTAWHEFGHSVDHIRAEFGRRPFPLNVEIHSMLFPIIFGDNPQTYIETNLMSNVMVGDKKDLYVQAAKGVLNGFILLQEEKNPSQGIPLIENDFNQTVIAQVQQWMQTFSTDQVRNMAKEIYKDPKKYLHTAQAGTYRGHQAAAEEIVEGAHGPPIQGFLLDGFGAGEISFGGGSRFIREGSYNFDAQKDLWTFIKTVFYIMFHPYEVISPHNSLEGIVSAVVFFILFETLIFGVHFLGSPLRKRKFHGVLIKDIIRDIYNHNPWSDGKFMGEEKGERAILLEIFSKDVPNIDPKVLRDMEAFKATTDKKKKVLFDVCLTLAPWAPKKAEVRSKWHNLLFWMPFLGPVLGRSVWMLPKQRFFHQRESFNQAIKNLCTSIRSDTSLDEFLKGYNRVLLANKTTGAQQTEELFDHMHFLDAVQAQIHQSINDLTTGVNLKKPAVSHRVAQSYQEDVEFDRLDKYIYGDDIKRIDWRATARAVNNEPVIRKTTGLYGLNAGFLFDMRDLHEHSHREKFAMDFVKSLRILGKDRKLKQIIVIMPNGEVFNQSVKIKFHVAPHIRADQLWSKLNNLVLEKEKSRLELNVLGLKFYTDEENERYCQRYKLTDFQYKSTEGIVFEELPVNNLNIFLVGMSDEHRTEVPGYLSPTNQVFHW